MNQDSNNLNQNKFNTQGNNVIPNNQPLQTNQNVNVNQAAFNNQQQVNTDYQQTTNQMNMQQPTPQPMNSFESENNSQSFNSKPPKKMNLGLIIGIIVAVAIVGVGVFLGSKLLSSGSNTDSSENNVGENNNSNDESSISDNEYINLLQSTYKVPGKEIYINYPYNRKNSATLWHPVELGFTKYWHVEHEMFIAFSCAINDVANDLEKAHELSFETFLHTFENENLNYMTTEKEENIKVNGIDMYKYIGKINFDLEGTQEKFAIGYSFIMDNTPCNITGFAYKAEETDDVVNEITKTVEAMATTVRSTK